MYNSVVFYEKHPMLFIIVRVRALRRWDDVATSLENTIADRVKACKIICDGWIYIVRGEQVYDIYQLRIILQPRLDK